MVDGRGDVAALGEGDVAPEVDVVSGVLLWDVHDHIHDLTHIV